MTASASLRADADKTGDDLAWLQDLMGVEPDGVPVSYLARPSAAEPRLLVPTQPGPAAAAAMRRLHGDRGLRGTLELTGGRLLGRAGLLGLAPGRQLTLPPFELVTELGRRLGEPDLVAAITLGPPRRNRKPVLQLLRPDGRVVGFAKVGWSDLTRELVTTEADMLRLAAEQLDRTVIAPSVIMVEHWRDLVVSVCTELRPSSGPTKASIQAAEVAGHIAAIERDRRPVERLPLIMDGLTGALGDTIDLPRLLARHGGVDVDTGMWHGDFTPWNMVARPGRTYLWDWEFAGRHRPVGFDLLHHRFERHRRRPGALPGPALQAVMAEADAILNRAGVEMRASARAAIVDLYLCELLARELQLNGQRWSGGEMALIGPVLIDTIQRRLA